MKDRFSHVAADYAQFRPGYPDALFEFLFGLSPAFNQAWDCATGNGQMALHLAERFYQVEATDLSADQLAHAIPHPRVRYSQQTAEEPLFSPGGAYPVFDPLTHEKTADLFDQGVFDLIVVGQAAHWFDLGRFYAVAKALLRPKGVLALVGYQLLQVDAGVDAVIARLYRDILGPFWDTERMFVDQAYQNLPFPFEEVPLPAMQTRYQWSKQHLLGYLHTWSAVKHFVRQHQCSPFDERLLAELDDVWPDGVLKPVQFPVFGKVTKP